MLGIVHFLTGAGLGAFITNQPVLLAIAFFSHYLLDATPHIDTETIGPEKPPYTRKQIALFVIDIICTVACILLLYKYRSRWLIIILAGLVAQLPDLMVPLYRFPIMLPLRLFHDLSHWNKNLAKHAAWYYFGIATQMVLSLAALWIIVR